MIFKEQLTALGPHPAYPLIVLEDKEIEQTLQYLARVGTPVLTKLSIAKEIHVTDTFSLNFTSPL